MNNKFENKSKEEKLLKKRVLDRTLHKNTGRNLSFSRYIKLKALYSFSRKFSYHYLKLG